eukprot:TRINITY_DN2430_c0_g1_i4.p1 TRINITY_DN2430_c0_g1~~TRINITY_DN2430_c0_g1_i4.p1  ORF type:complete len:286 (-),score=-4.37 TRINITY_DN2430_c0_g1_i4:332-1189(-)
MIVNVSQIIGQTFDKVGNMRIFHVVYMGHMGNLFRLLNGLLYFFDILHKYSYPFAFVILNIFCFFFNAFFFSCNRNQILGVQQLQFYFQGTWFANVSLFAWLSGMYNSDIWWVVNNLQNSYFTSIFAINIFISYNLCFERFDLQSCHCVLSFQVYGKFFLFTPRQVANVTYLLVVLNVLSLVSKQHHFQKICYTLAIKYHIQQICVAIVIRLIANWYLRIRGRDQLEFLVRSQIDSSYWQNQRCKNSLIWYSMGVNLLHCTKFCVSVKFQNSNMIQLQPSFLCIP